VIRDSAGNFYGTTWYGGANAVGAIFKMSPADLVTLLYSFTTVRNKNQQPGGLVRDSTGNLYGITQQGGNGSGAVFKLDTANNFTILHPFVVNNGWFPVDRPALLLQKGTLYGTVENGGPFLGAVFSTNASNGKSTILYGFNGTDGSGPLAGVITDGAGNLFGTTQAGGTNGHGVVYMLNIATRSETVLHNFTGGADGSQPSAGLLRDSLGNLYGTTYFGGAFNFGTVFKLDTANNLTTLHGFTGGADGAYPFTGLVQDSLGNLYGTATFGGSTACTNGCGTVFVITP
jgi:uncharacterized repeat protein (TIGR03803 family)